jgi:hypothetical protein
MFLKKSTPADNLFQHALNANPYPIRVRDLRTGVGVFRGLGESDDRGEEGVVHGDGDGGDGHWSNFGGLRPRQAYLLKLYAPP